jgi:hypothetical protein
MKKESTERWIYALILIGLAAIIPTESTRADIGPKPSI